MRDPSAEFSAWGKRSSAVKYRVAVAYLCIVNDEGRSKANYISMRRLCQQTFEVYYKNAISYNSKN